VAWPRLPTLTCPQIASRAHSVTFQYMCRWHVRLYVWVQHGCGFAAWNSTLDSYPYSANKAPHPIDVVRPFVASAQAAGVGYGFYYSECRFFVAMARGPSRELFWFPRATSMFG
jgi:hypothetical protein